MTPKTKGERGKKETKLDETLRYEKHVEKQTVSIKYDEK